MVIFKNLRVCCLTCKKIMGVSLSFAQNLIIKVFLQPFQEIHILHAEVSQCPSSDRLSLSIHLDEIVQYLPYKTIAYQFRPPLLSAMP